MIWQPLVALALVAVQPTPAPGQVHEVSVVPAGGDTEIVVISDASVEAREFLLTEPSRLIIDLHGASAGDLRGAYDEIGRGGVVRLRTSQFRSDVVRLVFDLTGLPSYETAASEGRFVVRFPNPGSEFEAWSSARREQVLAMEDRAPGPTMSGHRTESRPSLQEVPARITVAYDSAGMLDVLAAFSEFAGVSIVPSTAVADLTVRGVDIRDQRWDVALDAILASQGLGWRLQSEGILIVDRLEGLRTRDTLQTETRVFRINYASADSVANTLAQLATPQRGQVVGYQGSNSVIVTDVPSVVARMDTLVQSLDRQTPQVSIEAKIIFVDRTDVNSLGIVYDLKDRTGNSINDVVAIEDPLNPGEVTNETLVDLSGESIAALANANDRVLNPSLQILATTAFGSFSLAAFLDALEQHQLSDVQAAPSIQVVDNHSARIQVGERTPIRVLEQGAQAAGATVAVQFEDTGIILEVTPHVTNNNQILLDVQAERSGVQTDLPDVGFNFTQQLGQTRLLLDNGETMVIGGLTLSEVDRNESGIPLLMDIPVLGALFRTTNNTERKQDLIILVTPHIVE
ncbi:MAG TPA: secretin N-terminal domain-containing protein [Gemmatimonadota bacterium]|nr:secretin N-terminal domain-containing protein [Gemmatimonadota bacterium]